MSDFDTGQPSGSGEAATAGTGNPPAGWYDDPQTAGQLRWWDGSAWSEHTHPGGAAGTPSATQSSAPQSTGGYAASGSDRSAGGYAPAAQTAGHGPLADVGSRFAALLLDGLITVVALFVLFVPFFIVFGILGTASNGGASTGLGVVAAILFFGAFLVVMVALFAYPVLFEGGRHGQTIGKWILNIRVVRADGTRPIGYGAAFGRNLAKGFLSGFLYIGYIWAFFDDRRRTWHDMLATTVVVIAPQPKPSLGQLVGDSLKRR